MVDTEQPRKAGGNLCFRAVRKLVERTRGNHAALFQDFKIRIPGNLSQREDRFGLQDFQFTLEVAAGESFGVLGESGSGKSTLIRAIARLVPAAHGRIVWMGRELGTLGRAQLRSYRSEMQLIFQDPFASLDPSMTVEQLVAEPLQIHRPLPKAAERAAVLQALQEAGLDPSLAARYPESLSGGQCQRVGIARALVLSPRLLVCDEPMSALDVSVQARMVALFQAVLRSRRLTIVLVSHHLGVVRALCTRALVLYRGRMMECAPVESLYAAPLHPYTQALLAAIPIVDPDRQPARLLSLDRSHGAGGTDRVKGCRFTERCPHAIEICREEVPTWHLAAPGHHVACHRWRDLAGVR